jgi:hypothetical protein
VPNVTPWGFCRWSFLHLQWSMGSVTGRKGQYMYMCAKLWQNSGEGSPKNSWSIQLERLKHCISTLISICPACVFSKSLLNTITWHQLCLKGGCMFSLWTSKAAGKGTTERGDHHREQIQSKNKWGTTWRDLKNTLVLLEGSYTSLQGYRRETEFLQLCRIGP